MPLHAFQGVMPTVDPTSFIAPSADLIGRVRIGARASVWFGAVLRGDIDDIEIGEGSNVQDGAVLHTDDHCPCWVGPGCTIGHRAIVHGARLEEGSLVGMGAIMLSGSRLGKGAVLAAGSVLPEGKTIPDGMLAMGIPARVVRPIHPFENARRYVELSAMYLEPVTHSDRDGIKERDVDD